MANYFEKLKDPRWQKKRLDIFERDEWACAVCKGTKITLNVHHGYYRKGADPWDYPDDTLWTICEDCHKSATETMQSIQAMLGQFSPAEYHDIDLALWAMWFITPEASSNLLMDLRDAAVGESVAKANAIIDIARLLAKSDISVVADTLRQLGGVMPELEAHGVA